ncbi:MULTISPECIES: 2'-5' RNA ligase family protein [unclassified Mesorhizobium]|uniref:2'-5' RNA ligase family protein n=1 Tax=unclassified Mesorhizobium TaxID=325217 RepID=UPI00112D3F75|nr:MULTISPECIES: 2'-5' RNA ligase family protein [unclassified Mesorhizobium]TPL02788.1 2'-5' RNA ligase [Mesorhizobium sp. B2-4-16]TPL71784.1 2'-5' RNA ligase [Mesorhizobium sp. B2-4-3]
MSRQQEFDFGIPLPPKQPKRPDRLFFALLLEAKYRSEFWALQRRLCDINGITGSLLLKERFHVSLQHVGDYKRLRSKTEFAAKRSGRLVEMTAFEVAFHHAVSFPGRPVVKGRPPSRPFVLLADNGPVCELSRRIGTAMKANGLKSADYFVPHMTLAYDEKFVPRQPIDPIGFVAREFVLSHSLRGLTIYKDLNRWPLMAAL